jgi:phosphoribosylformylglycinamidine synthase
MRTAAATGPGNLLLIVGATTGRDGILGAAFAAEDVGESHEHAARRSHVQVGDPFMGKKLMEAMLGSATAGCLRDLGACGIACATSEMATRAAAASASNSPPCRSERDGPLDISPSRSDSCW